MLECVIYFSINFSMEDFQNAAEEGNLERVKYFIEQEQQNINERFGSV